MTPNLTNIAVKDNIVTVGSRTTCGSGILREYRSPFEAGVVRNLRLHSSSVSGKTNLDEFGMGSHSTHSFFGPVTNIPPFAKLSVGGSSGGSAAAVASGQCSIALGTDTGGSVRLPAAYAGIVGFKPSYGAISRWGVVPYANSMDTVGIMALDITSIKTAFYTAQRHDPRDPTSLSDKAWKRLNRQRTFKPGNRREAKMRQMSEARELNMFGIRIGVPLEYNIAELEPGIRHAWRDCLGALRDEGAIIVPISLPNTKHALSAYYILAPAEAASNLSKYDGVRYGTRDDLADGSDGVLYARTRGNGFGDEVKRRILLGSYTLSSEAVDNYFLKAQKVRRLVQRDFDRIFATPNRLRPHEQFDLKDMDESIQMDSKLGPTQVDFIICPTAPTLPPTLDDVSEQTPVDTYMNDVFTVPASLAGIPAMSVPFPIPVEFRSEGKPAFAGMQIIGQYASDLALIKMAETMMSKLTPTGLKSPTPETTNTFVFKKGRNPVLEEGGLPIRKTTTLKGKDPKTMEGEPLIWKIAEREKATVLRAEEGEQPVRKDAKGGRALLPAWKPKNFYYKNDSIPNGDRGELRVRKHLHKLPIHKYISERGGSPAPESKQSELLIRKVSTDKGGPERLPRTNKEVHKVLEDALKTWNF